MQFANEKDSELDVLRAMVEEADKKTVQLSQDLEDERRKVEDLTFQLEENKIFHDDLEVRVIQMMPIIRFTRCKKNII